MMRQKVARYNSFKNLYFICYLENDSTKSSKLLQNVKYDSSTGKMYEELGVTGLTMPTGSVSGNPEGTTGSLNSASAAAAAAAATAAALAGTDYYQNYQNYPYGSSNYMSSFNYGTNGPVASNYDRTSV